MVNDFHLASFIAVMFGCGGVASTKVLESLLISGSPQTSKEIQEYTKLQKGVLTKILCKAQKDGMIKGETIEISETFGKLSNAMRKSIRQATGIRGPRARVYYVNIDNVIAQSNKNLNIRGRKSLEVIEQTLQLSDNVQRLIRELQHRKRLTSSGTKTGVIIFRCTGCGKKDSKSLVALEGVWPTCCNRSMRVEGMKVHGRTWKTEPR